MKFFAYIREREIEGYNDIDYYFVEIQIKIDIITMRFSMPITDVKPLGPYDLYLHFQNEFLNSDLNNQHYNASKI